MPTVRADATTVKHAKHPRWVPSLDFLCRKNTLADNKRAVHAGDEWANIYQFNIAVGGVAGQLISQQG